MSVSGCCCCYVTSVMSDSVWPHRRQPTRLPRPWDSPGKNTGVGCHFLLQCMKVKSESEVAQSCPTLLDPMDCSLPGCSIHGIFQARVLEWGAIAFSGQFQEPLFNNARYVHHVFHPPSAKHFLMLWYKSLWCNYYFFFSHLTRKWFFACPVEVHILPFLFCFPEYSSTTEPCCCLQKERQLWQRQPGWWMEFNLCNIHVGRVLWVNQHGSTSPLPSHNMFHLAAPVPSEKLGT